MKTFLITTAAVLALSTSALADDTTLPLITFQEGAQALLDVSECGEEFVEPVTKAANSRIDGRNVVLVFTPTMVQDGVEAEGAEPFAIGSLKEPATQEQIDSLIGKTVCNEPW